MELKLRKYKRTRQSEMDFGGGEGSIADTGRIQLADHTKF